MSCVLRLTSLLASCIFLFACTSERPFSVQENGRLIFELGELTRLQSAFDSAALPATELGRGGVELVPDSETHTYFWLGDSLLNSQIPWGEYGYLVAEVYHENPYTTVLYMDFFKKNAPDSLRQRPWIQPRAGILPQVPTQIIIPLHHLNGQEIYIKDRPRVVKAMSFGKPMQPEEILKVGLRVSPVQFPHFQPKLQIRKLFLSKEEPEPLPAVDRPVVDAFGQWTARDWPGKIRDEADLKARLTQLADSAAQAAFPDPWSPFGGLKSLNFGGTGFFRTHHDGQRWWLVDPDGYAFLSAGLDGVRPVNPFLLQGDEDLFAELPPKTDSLFAKCYAERKDIAGNTFQTVDLTRANLMRVWGAEWAERWQQLAVGLLKMWRFNTIANWSDGGLTRRGELPWVLPLANFPDTKTHLFRDFPDVFSPDYQQQADTFARQLERYRNDRMLIGYFMRNEPHWAFGNFNLALEMLATAQPSHTKDELVRWLSARYGEEVPALNAAWQTAFTSFEQIVSEPFPSARANAQARADLWAFSAVMVDRYVAVPALALRKVDAHHLNLGMRYSFIENELCYQAGSYFDVFSINGYHRPGPPPTAEITRRTGKPVMIGEFHFGAVDRGLPTNGIQGVLDQAQRAQAYEYYVEQGFARPELIGIHYFLLLDQPINGRWDGENNNIGFVDVAMQPYPELTRAAARAHSRMYAIAQGKTPPYDRSVPYIAKNSE